MNQEASHLSISTVFQRCEQNRRLLQKRGWDKEAIDKIIILSPVYLFFWWAEGGEGEWRESRNCFIRQIASSFHG